MSLTSIFINDGLSDITQKRNIYGVAKNLMETILSYRKFPCTYDEIRSGFYPSSKWFIKNAIIHATLGGHKHLVEYFVECEEKENIREFEHKSIFDRHDKPKEIDESIWRDGLEKALSKRHRHSEREDKTQQREDKTQQREDRYTNLINYFLEKSGKTFKEFDLAIQYNYTPLINYFMPLIDQFTNKHDKDVCWKIGFIGAVKGNNKKYIDYFLSKNITFSANDWILIYPSWDRYLSRQYWLIDGDTYYPTPPLTNRIIYCSQVSWQTILKLAVENDNTEVVELCFNRGVRITHDHMICIFAHNNPLIINMLENYSMTIYNLHIGLIYCLIGAVKGNHKNLIQSLLQKLYYEYPSGFHSIEQSTRHFARVVYYAVINKNQTLIDSIMGNFAYIRRDLALFAGCTGDWSLYSSILEYGLEGAIDIHDRKQIDYFINKGSIIKSHMVSSAETSGYTEIYEYINKKYVEQNTHLMSLKTPENNCMEINGSHVNIVDAKFMSEDMDASIRTQINEELWSQINEELKINEEQ